ncbi:hypothetical protein CAPTEDRAFT_189780 [Capitella teleta]|uniref:MCMDC2 N-terminal domain-containing protein n=1 Tax=Capitella teleta TaxID=283909 RepID=R7VEE4_CAPTE|nr:hypothetical protein CAPTEDRAFT_189780 [Capitella teleta]|eukprot:ELU16957.1 hypothetical protein CAPTEDRAFT_189780 [Capitella teleta]
MQSTLHANDEGGMLASAKEYMAQTSGWEAVFASCLRYSTSEMADFNFIVAIEPSDLCDIDATLANLVLNDVHAATRIFEQAVYDEIVAKQLLTSCEELSQVSVTLRILNLPPLPLCVLWTYLQLNYSHMRTRYTLKSAKDLHKTVATNRCFSFDGIVIAVSVAHKQLKSTRYRCPAFDCTSHKKRPIRVDGRSPSQSLRCCTHCGCILVEDISSRILQDELCIELVEQGSLDGRVMLRQSISAVVFERGFFTSLASAFADDVIPPGSFLLMKCVLLLGLVQNQQPSVRNNSNSEWWKVFFLRQDSVLVDFLLVGEETLLIERLMIHAASFAERSITHRSLNALAFSSLKDKCYGICSAIVLHANVHLIHTAGSLLLAHNGVCVIPELDSMKKSAKDQLLQSQISNSALFAN